MCNYCRYYTDIFNMPILAKLRPLGKLRHDIAVAPGGLIGSMLAKASISLRSTPLNPAQPA